MRRVILRPLKTPRDHRERNSARNLSRLPARWRRYHGEFAFLPSAPSIFFRLRPLLVVPSPRRDAAKYDAVPGQNICGSANRSNAHCLDRCEQPFPGILPSNEAFRHPKPQRLALYRRIFLFCGEPSLPKWVVRFSRSIGNFDTTYLWFALQVRNRPSVSVRP